MLTVDSPVADGEHRSRALQRIGRRGQRTTRQRRTTGGREPLSCLGSPVRNTTLPALPRDAVSAAPAQTPPPGGRPRPGTTPQPPARQDDVRIAPDPPRRARRSHDARRPDWRRPPKRSGGVAGSPTFMAVPCDICSARVGYSGGQVPGEATGLGQLGGLPPAVDGLVYAVSYGAVRWLVRHQTKDQRFGLPFATGITPISTGCRRPCKQHCAHRRAAREICPASAQQRWLAGLEGRVSSP